MTAAAQSMNQAQIETEPRAAESAGGALVAVLRRLDSLLERALKAAEVLFGPEAAADPYRGLHIAKAETDRLLARGPGSVPLYAGRVWSAEAVAAEGAGTRLATLQRLFGLSAFDIDVLLIALAPEIDLRYERLYAYLQDDVTKKRPSVDLVLNLLCESFAAKLAARTRFSSSAPAFKHLLLRLSEDPSHHQPPLLSKYLKIDDRVVSYLLGVDDLDARLLSYATYAVPRSPLPDTFLSSDLAGGLDGLVRQLQVQPQPMVLYLQGPYGVGKLKTAESVCAQLGRGLLVVDGEQLLPSEGLGPQTAVQLVLREALLRDAIPYWKGFDALLAPDRRPWLNALVRGVEEWPGLAFLAGNTAWEPADAWHQMRFMRIELPRPAYADRVRIWCAALEGTPTTPDVDPKALANKFRLSGGQVRDAVATACNLASWGNPDRPCVGMSDLSTACRLQSNRTLSSLARKITPHYQWDDIVLPADRLQQLREICNSVKYRSLVYDQWGFDRKLALGKGLNVLFAGPSGTGKTMAADIMAGELGLDLYKIDLSTVVSKYIGETEKNLARIFAEAETSNAILFFDEADALFGKRSEVRDSHDRYANIEINYLLQKMEEHEGVVILATNFFKNMDDAFVRRLHHTVEFPFPEEADRRRIWERTWPAELPHSSDLDLDVMARRYEMGGGNIRNIVLAAAFLAADDGGTVNMAHLLHGTRREYQKMGKVVAEREFGHK